jgi:lon-related putative ATP-dependent protease
VKENYKKNKRVIAYLDEVQNFVLMNISSFIIENENENVLAQSIKIRDAVKRKLKANLFVNNRDLENSPIVIEKNPSFYNIFGKIERVVAPTGMVNTDFSMLKAGSLARANGGYLIIDAVELLTKPGVWEKLKTTIKNSELILEDMGQNHSLIPYATMRPEELSLDVKVIMLGTPSVYQQLYHYDSDFKEIFKVKADFDTSVKLNDEQLEKYIKFVATRCKEEDLTHFTKKGVEEIIQYANKITDNRDKLSTRFNKITDIIREASYLAEREGSNLTNENHVKKSLEMRKNRANLYEDKILESMEEGTYFVETEGERVGQINGLAVLDSGDYAFGKPLRITVKNYIGAGNIIDIQRAIKMSGNSYNKGVMTLNGYIMSMFAHNKPFKMNISISVEQSYGPIDGDSASSAELYATLSSLSNVPIKQSIAVTGSVNQHGEIQPIGGVNEKIRGFFRVCKMRGLTGDQGVMIPKSNEKNLFLDDEILEAVKAKNFHIYSVETIEDGLEVLTGMKAGSMRKDNCYTKNTVFCEIDERIKSVSKMGGRMIK